MRNNKNFFFKKLTFQSQFDCNLSMLFVIFREFLRESAIFRLTTSLESSQYIKNIFWFYMVDFYCPYGTLLVYHSSIQQLLMFFLYFVTSFYSLVTIFGLILLWSSFSKLILLQIFPYLT